MTAIYPGSFDPFSNGHLNVLKHVANLFEKVYIVVMEHPQKSRFVSVTTSRQLIEKSITGTFNNVEVVVAETSLIYKEAQRLNCDYIVRGIRNNGVDYTYEENLAEFNKAVGGIDTLFVRADVDKNISSTMIKLLLTNGESITDYVPDAVSDYLKTYLRRVLIYDNRSNR